MEDAWLAGGKLAALAQEFPAWQIDRIGMTPTWVAVLRHGTRVHVLAAHSLDTLRGKLEKADACHHRT
jgi:hypothetical protein